MHYPSIKIVRASESYLHHLFYEQYFLKKWIFRYDKKRNLKIILAKNKKEN